MVQRKTKGKLTAQEKRHKAALKGWKTRRANQKRAEKDARDERKAIQSESQETDRARVILIAKVMMRRAELTPKCNAKTVYEGTFAMTDRQLKWASRATESQLRHAANDKRHEVDGYNPFWYH